MKKLYVNLVSSRFMPIIDLFTIVYNLFISGQRD